VPLKLSAHPGASSSSSNVICTKMVKFDLKDLKIKDIFVRVTKKRPVHKLCASACENDLRQHEKSYFLDFSTTLSNSLFLIGRVMTSGIP
jgi:hypothetical protein